MNTLKRRAVADTDRRSPGIQPLPEQRDFLSSGEAFSIQDGSMNEIWLLFDFVLK